MQVCALANLGSISQVSHTIPPTVHSHTLFMPVIDLPTILLPRQDRPRHLHKGTIPRRVCCHGRPSAACPSHETGLEAFSIPLPSVLYTSDRDLSIPSAHPSSTKTISLFQALSTRHSANPLQVSCSRSWPREQMARSLLPMPRDAVFLSVRRFPPARQPASLLVSAFFGSGTLTPHTHIVFRGTQSPASTETLVCQTSCTTSSLIMLLLPAAAGVCQHAAVQPQHVP